MTAQANSWGVSYSAIAWLEGALKGHKRVTNFVRERDIVFVIDRPSPFPAIRLLLLSEYTLGLATLLKAQGEFPDVNCIIVGSDWNAYTQDAKQHSLGNSFGLFTFSEFFGAIHYEKFYEYAKKDDHGKPIYAYRSA
jgi:hypothetical protein